MPRAGVAQVDLQPVVEEGEEVGCDFSRFIAGGDAAQIVVPVVLEILGLALFDAHVVVDEPIAE